MIEFKGNHFERDVILYQISKSVTLWLFPKLATI